MKNLVTGGAGFIGSNLIDKLLKLNQKVICLDDFSTGLKSRILNWSNNPLFEMIEHNITQSIDIKADRIWHLACPASPIYYQKNPIETAKINFLGTLNVLEIARKNKSKILFASSSEIYGDTNSKLQSESIFGNINPIGKRSCYGEGKRIAESLCYDYMRTHNLDIRVARLFNIYGPMMSDRDGRVISNFINQALHNTHISIYGDGSQTRSFCYVDDVVEGIIKLMDSNYKKPVNIGNPHEEYRILDLALLVKEKINSEVKIEYFPISEDDPKSRRPDISIANNFISWSPKISLNKGLEYTINYFKTN